MIASRRTPATAFSLECRPIFMMIPLHVTPRRVEGERKEFGQHLELAGGEVATDGGDGRSEASGDRRQPCQGIATVEVRRSPDVR